MRHVNSVFHQITQHINWSVWDRLVETHKADFRTRRCTAKAQFLALLFGQLSGARSLREIEAGLNSHQSRLYHAGARQVARSTLSDVNNNRSWQLFADMFTHMVASGGRAARRRMGESLRILDATAITLGGTGSDWARFSRSSTAAKIHVVYDPVSGQPLRADVTPYNVNDITVAKTLTLEPKATYVFDLGYYDYGWWAQMDALECRFVTRLKRNTRLRECTERSVQGQSDNILYDRVGTLPARLARSRKNPMSKPVREIGVCLDTGKTIRVVTNDLDSPASVIADLYKTRWQIELFFKWVKQNLKIRHFIGTSQNAVRIQVYVALIAFLLIRKAKDTQSAVAKHITFIRLVRLNIMHRRPISDLTIPHRPPPIDTRQGTLELAIC